MAKNPLISDMDGASPSVKPIDRLMKPLQVFAQNKLAGAGLLMLATVTVSYTHLTLPTILRV